MRARRLAKLAAMSNAANDSSSNTGEKSSATASDAAKASSDGKENAKASGTESRPAITIKPAQPAAGSTQQPSAGPGSKDGKARQAAATPSGTIGSSKKRRRSAIDSASATPPPTTGEPMARRPFQESLEDWTDQTLSSAFRISVDPAQTRDAHGRPLTFLPGLSQELQERGQALKLTTDDLDPAILEAATAFSLKKPLLDYLLPCWKAIIRSVKQLRDTRPEKTAALQEAKRLCMSNCIFALTMPEYFG